MCKDSTDFDAYNFADGTTPYVCGKNLDFVGTKLEEYSIITIKSFENNYMKMDSAKCYLFISEKKNKHLWAKIDSTVEK